MEAIKHTNEKETLKGGGFIFHKSDPSDCFTPEDYSEDQHMLRKTIRDFLNKEVEPLKDVLDTTEGTKIAPEMLERLGSLGFMAISLPERFGGMEADIRTESSVLRLLKNKNIESDSRNAIGWLLLHMSAQEIKVLSQEIIYTLFDDNISEILESTGKLLELPPKDLLQLQRIIATVIIRNNKYEI